jgi:hypothetical protein
MASSSRHRCLRLVVEHLGSTRAGRDLDLERVRSLEDLRGIVPIMDPRTHEREVESRIGFGVHDGPELGDASSTDSERDHVVAVWRAYLDGRPPVRTVLLRGVHADPVVDSIMRADLEALGGELSWIGSLDEPEEVVRRIQDFEPEMLVVPSALTCRLIERVLRGPLERELRRLRLVLAEHDLGRRLRTRIPVRSAGWIHRGGRCAVATLREPKHAVTLAFGSQIIELLPYTNPEEDARRVYAEQTVLPEHAVVGMRYEVVLTSPLGFLRMRTNEHVRVVGFDAPSIEHPFPRPRVIRLPPAPPDVRLEGCTVAGAWLTASIRQALWREDPALVAAEIGVDPLSRAGVEDVNARSASLPLHDAFKETELAWLARTGAHEVKRRHPRSLLVRIELQGHVSRDLPLRLAERIDHSLRRRSPAYAYLRERNELEPPRVVVQRSGTRITEEHRRTIELLGAVWVPDVRVVDGR